MLEPGHPLRLPSWRTTGNLFFGGFFGNVEFGQQVAQTWQGKIVGLATDQVGYPILWTPATVAGFRGLTVAGYAAQLPYNVAVARQTGKTPLMPPRMIIYDAIAARDACQNLGAQLQARHVAAFKHPTNVFGGLPELNGGNVFLGCCPPTAVVDTTDVDVQSLPNTDESRWVGGEVLVLCECQFGEGAVPFSFYDHDGTLGGSRLYPDCVSKSRSLWNRFQTRYYRLAGHACSFTGTNTVQDVAANSYHDAAYNAAVASQPGITYDGLGVFSNPVLSFPLRVASFESAIKSFFGIP